MLRELAKIKSTFLGYEDHGHFTFSLDCELESGGGQSFGMYDLRSEDGWRILAAIIGAVGVEQWEDLPGSTVYVLRDENHGLIRGLAPGPFQNRGKAFRIHQGTGKVEEM